MWVNSFTHLIIQSCSSLTHSHIHTFIFTHSLHFTLSSLLGFQHIRRLQDQEPELELVPLPSDHVASEY
eukprot:GABW01002799.1.p2 GENE.GABW01002799.1~~GABW01002799.1.p2  ORF type:complete len:69 (+),score=7.05 GABW01002799.1:74-280(+)